MVLFFETLTVIGSVLFMYMSLFFVYALIRKRNDIADFAWGFGFILVALVSLFLFAATPRKELVVVLVALWGLRLAMHIYFRNRGKKEDWRYKKWREDWGKWFIPRTYLQVFLLQGVLLLLIALPIIFVNTFDTGTVFGLLDFVAVLIWLFGFYFETVGDYQLYRFIKNPDNKGKIMKEGLWKYTRHPNYFGEITMWWGIWLIALSVPYGWISVIGPLTITVLITKVSGIPMLEKKYEGDPEYEEYKKKTSRLIPWLKKADTS